MNRSFARWAALACTSAALALFSAGAFAQATVTLTDPNCLYFTLTPAAGPSPQTLACVQSTTPLCTISGPTAATIGTPITLNSTCVPAATTYAWTGGGCTNTKNCTDPGTGYTNGQVVPYTLTGTNGAGAGPTSAAWNVTWTTTPPVAPGGCSISGAPSGNQTAGVSVTLTMNCTTGGAPSANGYVWAGAGTAGMTGATAGPITVNTTTTFTATASNGGGTSPPASATVTIGGGGGGITCNGFVNTRVLPITWSSTGLGVPIIVYSKDAGGFGPNDALVVTFTTPSGTSGNIGQLNTGEYQSGTADIIMELSSTACDFSAARNTGAGVTFGFSVGPNSQGALPLNPSTTYYVNMKHNSSCTGICNIIFTLDKPSGL